MPARRHPSLIPLSHDHQHALALAFRLHHPAPPGPVTGVTPPSTPATRAAEVLAHFTAELDGHFRAEEEVLFPALAAAGADRALLDALVSEHRRMRELRDRVAAGDPVALEPVLTELADVLEAHVRREERQLFPAFDALVPPAEAERLGAAIRAALARRRAS